MVPNNIIPSVMNYANSCAALKAAPTCEQVRAGVIPLDSLPAAWWNCMWYDTNRAVNCTRYGISSIIQEINSVLAATGRQVDQCCVNQLYESIEDIRQTIGTNLCAGAVKPSLTGGQVSIDGTTGIMTVNDVGNAALLTTSSHTVVNAINELNQVYSNCLGTLATNAGTIDSIKVNKAHASTSTAYGVGNAADYGHLKISDTYNANLNLSGMAASQKAVSDMYGYFASMVSGIKACTNTVVTYYPGVNCTAGYLLTTTTSGYTQPVINTCLFIDCFHRFSSDITTCYAWASTPWFLNTLYMQICSRDIYMKSLQYQNIGVPISLTPYAYGFNSIGSCNINTNLRIVCCAPNTSALGFYGCDVLIGEIRQYQCTSWCYQHGSQSTCRSGVIALAGWNCIQLCNGCVPRRCITASINGYTYTCGLYRTCHKWYDPYSGRCACEGGSDHISFVSYINPLYVPMHPECEGKVSVILGSSEASYGYAVFPNTCCYASRFYCFNPYGASVYRYNNINRLSTQLGNMRLEGDTNTTPGLWLECFRACLAYGHSSQMFWYWAMMSHMETYDGCCANYANPPIYQFHIES